MKNIFNYNEVIKKGCILLMSQKGYKQINIVNKLDVLGCRISPALLNKILKDKEASRQSLKSIGESMLVLVNKELGLSFNEQVKSFSDKPEQSWKEEIVEENAAIYIRSKDTKLHIDGRVTIDYKTSFYSDAKFEIIQIGVRLNTYSQYFTSQNSTVYKDHIIELLERGVNIKAYLIDPDCNEARLYFDDRSITQKTESYGTNDIKRVIERLCEVRDELNNLGHKGHFEVYKYKHFPYGNFVIVDGNTSDGKMMVAHYLYGIKRADIPVWEFSKKSHPKLYRKYLDSVQKYIEKAVPITEI